AAQFRNTRNPSDFHHHVQCCFVYRRLFQSNSIHQTCRLPAASCGDCNGV
ncbi:MAG: hypothetical protein, partial [Olavius algarvensis Gamma 3 endosymbiont]